MSSDPPATSTPDLPALYRSAVETGDAAELVRALCQVHGVSLRGLAELAGISYDTIWRWTTGKRGASALALRGLDSLLKPTKTVQRRIAEVRSRLPFGLRGRPKKV